MAVDHRPEAAEALGVFTLVFAGVGAIMVDARTGALGHVGVALTFGFVILVLIYALGHICGAHYNPAITIAFAATGHFPWRRVPTYLLAQVSGAVLAALSLHVLLGPEGGLGVTAVVDGLALWKGFVFEVLTTFFLALVIIGVATDARAARGAAGLAIGLTVALDALFAGPLTGASMNPARSIGPAVVAGELGGLWLYIIAPVLGATAAMMTYELLREGRLSIRVRTPLGSLGPFDLNPPEHHIAEGGRP